MFSIVIPTLDEERYISELIRSIYAQDYRPIEVIIVDGGSKDKTLQIVEELKKELSNKEFKIRVILQNEVSKLRNVTDAYNLGIKNAKGNYIAPMDADVVLLDKNFLCKLRDALKENIIVRYNVKIIPDTWLERNLMLDQQGYTRLTQAYRREFFNDFLFDVELDIDHDISIRLQNVLKDAKTLKLEVGVHEPQTLSEYFIHKFWHGKLIWPQVRKNPRSILGLSIPSGPFLLLLLASLTFFVNVTISLIFLTPWLISIIYLYFKSPKKSLSRLTYIMVRLTFGSFARTMGITKGSFDYLRGKLELGRSI